MTANIPHKSDDDVPFEEKDRIWSLMYQKISGSIKQKQNFAILFSGVSESDGEGYSAIITQDQYKILLEGFLDWSKEQERYEICSEVNKLIKELESWKKKN